jgi:formylglycine-generating enzyme required for sulfatase activity
MAGAAGTCDDPADERIYPWGDVTPTCANGLANFASCVGDTEPAGAHPGGDSPYGLQDMAGNVWDWVADWYDPGCYAACGPACSNPDGPSSSPGGYRVLRGCGWSSVASHVRVSDRDWGVPSFRDNNIGVRCAGTPRDR